MGDFTLFGWSVGFGSGILFCLVLIWVVYRNGPDTGRAGQIS